MTMFRDMLENAAFEMVEEIEDQDSGSLEVKATVLEDVRELDPFGMLNPDDLEQRTKMSDLTRHLADVIVRELVDSNVKALVGFSNCTTGANPDSIRVMAQPSYAKNKEFARAYDEIVTYEYGEPYLDIYLIEVR